MKSPPETPGDPNTMAPRGLRAALNSAPVMPRNASLSDGRGWKSQSKPEAADNGRLDCRFSRTKRTQTRPVERSYYNPGQFIHFHAGFQYRQQSIFLLKYLWKCVSLLRSQGLVCKSNFWEQNILIMRLLLKCDNVS